MTDQATETKPAKKPSGNILLWLLTWIAIIAVASYTVWQKETTDKTESAHMQAIMETLQAQEKIISTLTEVAETHEQQFQQIATHSNEVVATLRTLSQQINPDDHTWRILKVQTYIDQAMLQLNLNDTNAAANLLNAAAMQIQQLNDPSLIPLHNAITADVKALRASSQIDKATLIRGINLIIQEVPHMPQKVHGPKTTDTQQPSPTNKTKNWQDKFGNAWQEIKSLVQVRRHGEPITPHISRDEHYLIGENLQLILQQANFAALQNRQELYTQQLKTAIDWMQQYYEINDPMVRDAMVILQKMSEQPVASNIPEQIQTMQAWDNFLDNMQRPPTPQVAPAPESTPAPEAATEPESEAP